MFPLVCIAFFHRKLFSNCETSAINDCFKELNCSLRLDLKLPSCNWKVAKLLIDLFVVMSKSFGFSLGKDKHSLSPILRDLTALIAIISWSSSSNVSWVISLSKELWTRSRSSHRRCSMKKGVLKIFAKFTGKHLFVKFLRAPFLRNTSGWLLQ